MELDIKKVTVLPRSEWERIKDRLKPQSEEDTKMQSIIADRERLHEKSIKTVNNWSNTIQGQRNRKLQARKLRLEAEEIELQKIDKEEAKFLQAKRREALDKAKTLQYYQTDRVKEFHSAMLLSEVLNERDKQVAMRKKLAKMQKDREAEYDSAYINQYKNQADSEELKKKLSKSRTLEVAEYQKHQRELKAKNLEKELRDDVLLGQSYKEQDDSHKEWVKEKHQKCLKQKKQLMHDVLNQIDQKRRLANFDAQQQAEEDEEIRLFDEAKRMLKTKRQQKEREIQEAKQAQRKLMVSKLEGDSEALIRRENELVEKYTKEKYAREDSVKEKKDNELARLLKEIKFHRFSAMDKIEQLKQDEKLKNEEDLFRRIKEDNIYLESEKTKCINRRKNAEKLMNFHIDQINTKAALERREVDRNLSCDKAQKEVQYKEEEEFQKYAGEVITRAKERNANIYPLLQAARPGAGGGHGPQTSGGLRPSFVSTDSHGVQLPTYQKDSTDDVKAIYGSKDMGHAKKRFGFVW